MEARHKHSDLILRLLPSLVIIVLAALLLVIKEKNKNKELKIIAIDAVTENVNPAACDSSTLEAQKKIRAIKNDNTDSLINNIINKK